MALLDFTNGGPGGSGFKKSYMYLIGIGALVGVIALGSTLAASINLNSGTPVEFGQGVAQAVSCAGTNQSITITPMSRFRNSEGGGTYRFSSFKVSDVPTECNGVNFTFKFYGSSGDALDPIGYNWAADNYPSDFNRTDINVHFEGEDTTGFGSNNLWDDNDYGFPASNNYSDVNDGSGIDSRTNSSFEVTFWYDATDAPGLLTDQLKSITVETSRTTSTSTGWINNGSAGGVLALINSPALSLANGGYLDFGNSAYATGSIGSTSGLTEITVAMRMNLPSGQCGMPFYWGTDNGKTSNGYDIWDCSGGFGGPTAFGFNTWQDDIYGTNSTSFYGDFHDFVFVFSPLSLAAEKLYIDGAEIPLTIYGAPDETTNRFPANGTFTLMSNGTGDSYHENGFIAAVKIYKRALTGPEAAEVFSGSAPSGAAVDVNASSSANFN
jgi:hypothetical protein